MLELVNIKKDYLSGENTVHALKGINLSFRKNEFVSILGQSGCGKTTLLNIIGGLDKYTEGDLIIDGRSTKEYNSRDWDTYRNHSIGFVFQTYNLIPHQNVLSNVEIALTLAGVNKKERKARALKALEEVGLASQIHKKPSEMSGGQMQRVAIARALVNNPTIILADEPTGALDSETSVQVMEILKEISKNRLVIMVTHNPELANKYSTRIISMLDGVIKNDTNPISEDEKLYYSIVYEEKNKLAKEKKKEEKKSSMNFLTASKLSLKNLFTKKGRTILTSFAGSIGIIGIALVLAVSNGTTNYINQVQEESLSSYPLSIEKSNTDISSIFSTFLSIDDEGEKHSEEKVFERPIMYNILDGIVNASSAQNDLEAFKIYLDKEMSNTESNLYKSVSGVSYQYGIDLQILTENEDKVIISDMTRLVNRIFSQYVSGNSDTTSGSNSLITSLIGSTGRLTLWEELLPGKDGDPISDFVKQQYDVVYGTWPNAYDQGVLVLNEYNEIVDTALYALGLKNEKDITDIVQAVLDNKPLPEKEAKSYTYEEICSKNFKTVLASECYLFNQSTNEYTDYRESDEGLEYLYNQKGFDLKISGIIRPKEDVNSPMLNGYVAYTHLLTDKIIKDADESEIVKKQLANKNIDVIKNLPFKNNSLSDSEKEKAFKEYISSLNTAEKAEAYLKIKSVMDEETLNNLVEQQTNGKTRAEMEEVLVTALKQQFQTTEDTIRDYINNMSDEDITSYYKRIIREYIKVQYAEQVKEQLKDISDEQKAYALDSELPTYSQSQCVIYYDEVLEFSNSTYEDNLIDLGKVDIGVPSRIRLYTSSFANKEIIVDEIKKYNDSVDEKQKIQYSDLMGTLMSAVNTIINAITYVLIAFVAISLVVSSVMIAIITLISVQERTKEIGILRAIGASKGNVSSMFNAETIIIGFTAGLLGVIVSYILLIPINLIIHAVTNIQTLSASLPIWYALILILISMLLTLISGFIPSRSAAKKDPVIALRTE